MAVRYYAVQALDREVPRWCQPLITSGTPGTVVLLGQRRSGVLRFLLRASPEPGFANAAQLSASFQSFPGDPPDAAARSPLLRAGETGAPPGYRVAMECLMSEEGGRFFRELNRYVVAVAPPEASVDDDSDQAWLTLGEITELKPTPGVFTNELRSALSLLVHYV